MKTFFFKHQKSLIIAGVLLVVLILSLFFVVVRRHTSKAVSIDLPEDITTGEEIAEDILDDPILEEDTFTLEEGMTINPLTGLIEPIALLEKRPLVIMFDNYLDARPQASLHEADLIYEILAEGRITRYMGIYYSKEPEVIGPIRSARPYFIEIALGFNPYFVHVGGSDDAFLLIKASGIQNIDAISSNPFWRVSHKFAPHNLYSSYEALIAEANRRQYEATHVPQFVDFYVEQSSINGEKVTEIECVYRASASTKEKLYYTSYIYNNEDSLYYRYTNNEPHLEETTSTHLTCTNIIVQYVETKVIDNQGRLKMDVIGTGTGKAYSNGECVSITWRKETATDPIVYFLENGDPLVLNPGVTWIQFMEIGAYENTN